ncbi:Diacylglycerol kinase catalytic domain family protein [Brugia pahangi]
MHLMYYGHQLGLHCSTNLCHSTTHILRTFCKLFYPVQVINIQQIGVGTALRWTNMFPEIDCRIIIADGDGTVSLSLDAINELQRKLPVAVLPLGTGNDLSRTLGWRPS